MRHVLGSLARRWLTLREEIKILSRYLNTQTKAAAPQLVAAVGIGLDIAAEMLVTAGDNSDRIRSSVRVAQRFQRGWIFVDKKFYEWRFFVAVRGVAQWSA